MHFAKIWMAGGTEEHSQRRSQHCDGLKREPRMQQARQVGAQGFDVKLTETFSESNHVSESPWKKKKKKEKPQLRSISSYKTTH